jgi:hypothetical protein
VNVKNSSLQPVEAFAQLVDYANTIFVDRSGIMWGLTNVLLGVDPNKTAPWKLGLKDMYNIHPRSNPYFIGEDWLIYNHDPDKGERHSERGDWKEKYWDGTPNQAFHFWYFAAVEYYDNFSYAISANLAHDPYMLEPLCGEDLEKLNGILGEDITKRFNETSKEDFLLGIKGIEFGARMWKTQGRYVFFDPGNWIRTNLSDN